jgi:hypothetical protein
MEKKHNIVYKTTNLVNGKIYIGVHSTNKLEDGYIGNGIYKQKDADRERFKCPFVNAVKKHGYNNFKREILYLFGSAELAFWWESYIVDDDFINREDNYNAVTGGSEGKGRMSKKSIVKMSKSLKGREVWNKRPVICITTGVVYPSISHAERETGALNIMNVARGKRGHSGSLNGIPLAWKYVDETPLITKDVKSKISSNSKGNRSANRRSVQCINTGEIFDCINVAAKKYKVSGSSIGACARGHNLSAGKLDSGERLSWKYIDLEKSRKPSSYISPLRKKIQCINTGEIFQSIRQACVKMKTNSIYQCLLGNIQYAGKLEDGTRLKWGYV